MLPSGAQVQQGRHDLVVDVPSEPIPLQVDGMRLSQVFANLLSNASKYSDPGTPIELSAHVGEDGVEVLVRDNGIGLDEEQARRIFELFVQADTAIERASGGLGIGLTLVQQLVEMQGGQVSVHSDGPGLGSEFRVQLPAALGLADAHQDPAATAPPPDLASGDGRRALVLDDNRDAADTLAMMLELMDFDVLTLYDPGAFDAAFADFGPDVVFLDVGMPGRSGYDVASDMRGMPGGTDVLLVAVTGWGQPEDRARSREAGFDRHLVKPPELPAIQAICRLLGERARDTAA